MMEYFTDWMPTSATLHRTVTTKNAAGQTVITINSIDGIHTFGKWVDRSVQTNQNDKFVNSETGKLAIDYQKFYITTIAGSISTTVEVIPAVNWYATFGGVKYFIDGVDNIGSLGEVYLFEYHKELK
jgi:hypothetical protein